MRYAILVMMLMLAAPFVSAADTVPSAPVLRLSLINQFPDPVEPGNYIELRWLVVNGGYSDAKDVTFEIVPTYPFSLPKGASAQQTFPVVAANPDEDEYIILYYKLRVDDKAAEGTEQISLRYRLGNGEWRSTQDEYDVRVQTYDTYLSVDSITSDPEIIAPGQTSKVALKLKNMADTTIKDARVNLGLDSADLPLSPVGSSNEKIVTSLTPGQTSEVEFTLAADAEAASGVYKVPLTLTYNDVNGDNYTTEKIFSLIVGADPEITLAVEETDILTAGKKGSVTVKFVNKGVTDIKFLDMTLQGSGQYEILSVPGIYIGNIDSDDYETADFELYVNADAGSEVKLPVKYEYRDSNNKLYTKENTLTIKLYNKEELEQYGYGQSNGSMGIVVIVIVALAGFFVWRRWKKKRKDK